MTLFRRGIPRRALMAAFLGFAYGGLVIPTENFLAGVGWVLLSVSLLFARPFSYYTYVTWCILWIAWKGVSIFRGELAPLIGALHVLAPLVSVGLLSSSGYLESTRPETDEVS